MHPIQKNNAIYLESVTCFPADHRGVKWHSVESQFLRFKILCEIAPDFWQKSVLDVGCGLGHLVDYLIEQDFTGVYKGIDILPRMIELAQQRYPNKDFEVNVIEELEQTYDYVVASGVFAFANWEILKELIVAMNQRACRGVAFNCLSGLIAPTQKEEGLFYPLPTEVLEFCRQITPKVSLRHDYLDSDFTIYIYK